jgi:membrane-bound lytic murein transglycosylase D
LLKKNLILFFILVYSIIRGQTEPVKLLTPEDIANDPSLRVTKVEGIQTPLSISKDSIALISVEKINQETPKIQANNPVSTPLGLSSFKLQDDPTLAAIDSKWMDLVKQSDLYDTTAFDVGTVAIEDLVITDLSTEVLKQRLATIDAKTPFHVTYNPELERLIKTYLKNRPKALANLMGKAKYYFPLFEEKLDKYDIPLEVKYLAIVESALRPKARSRVGATGLWQFMYQTGKQYGLNVSSYIDQRQDPYLATEAACKYLTDLYDIFNDWDLALAAYNSGPGNVSKAIRRSGGNHNYWNLRGYLPRETASYVPIFYATLYLFEYANAHKLQASSEYNIHNFEVDSVHISKQLTFEQIQKTTGINESLLEFLNPSYKLNIIPKLPNKTQTLVLPREYIGLFVQNESQIYAYAQAEEAKREKPLPKYFEMDQRIRYRVRSGDYLGRIAEKYGVSVRKIKRWNKLRSNKLRIGQRLTIYPRRVPGIRNKKVTKKASAKKRKIKTPKGKYSIYTVKEGDSFWSISKKYPNVSVAQIKEWNGIWGNKLSVGTKLKIYKS